MKADQTHYCPNCECDRPFVAESRNERYELRGESFELTVPVWVCGDCGESVVDPGFGDPTVQVMDLYRNRRGLLTAAEIRRIREQWHLSQVAFATLLGMSPATINRYEQGSVQQDKEDELLRACDSASFMHDVLRRRGHLLTERQRSPAMVRLGTAVATSTSEPEPWASDTGEWMPVEVSPRSGFRRFSYRRYAAAVAWLCANVDVVTQTKLYKLLFYADFASFKATSLSFTGALYRRMPYGPVPVGFNGLRTQLEADEIVTINEVAFQNGNTGEVFRPGPRAEAMCAELTDDDMPILRLVRDRLGGLTPSALSDRSHEEAAWKETPSKAVISYEKALTLSVVVNR